LSLDGHDLWEAFFGRVPANGPRDGFPFRGASRKTFGRFETSEQVQGARLGTHDHRAIPAQRPSQALARLHFERFANCLRHCGLSFICQSRC
jgi:hypothetical protein